MTSFPSESTLSGHCYHPTKRRRFAAPSGGTKCDTQQSPHHGTSGQTYVNQSLLDDALKKEITRYSCLENRGADVRCQTCYRPAPLSKPQLCKAAKEFVRRCQEDVKDQSDCVVPYVLVSQNCRDIPSRDFELQALQATTIGKLWYALTKTGDLLIIKYASSDAHADGVAELVSEIRSFARQFGTVQHPVFSRGSDGKKSFCPEQ
jgi:hypothetical protein